MLRRHENLGCCDDTSLHGPMGACTGFCRLALAGSCIKSVPCVHTLVLGQTQTYLFFMLRTFSASWACSSTTRMPTLWCRLMRESRPHPSSVMCCISWRAPSAATQALTLAWPMPEQ